MPYQFVQRAVDPDMPQMVGLGGLEPPTLPLSGVRSNHLSYRPIPICRDIGLPGRVSTRRVRYMPGLASRRCRRRAFPGPQKRGRGIRVCRRGAARAGGASRDRTDDPLLAKQVLSQLSYGPVVDGGREGRAIAQGAARIIPSCFWIAGVLCGRRIGLGRPVSRKEVIQPHLPIRLPCYDFTPVIDHTVASALLAVRLPASGATNSHGVTGGVYKARERIHRGNADPRLLAIPTSWSRVADSNPDWDRFSGIGSASRHCNPLYRPL